MPLHVLDAVDLMPFHVLDSEDLILLHVKSALGIHSPSRLFRDEIGLNIGYGVGEGVEASQPSILKSVSGVADAIADEFNAGDYKVGNIVPASEVDGALSSFSDRISGCFTACLTGFRPLRITSRSPFPLWLAVSCPTRPQQPQQAAAELTSARPLKRPMTRSQALLRRS